MTRGPAVRGTAEYRGKTAVPVLHVAVPSRFRILEYTENNGEPRSTAVYRGIAFETRLRFGTGRSMDRIDVAWCGFGSNFDAPCPLSTAKLHRPI